MVNGEKSKSLSSMNDFFISLGYVIVEEESDQEGIRPGITDVLATFHGFKIGAYDPNGRAVAIDIQYGDNQHYSRYIDDDWSDDFDNADIISCAKIDIMKWIQYDSKF